VNYAKHYSALIERAKCRTLSGYSELHHVVPKCLGGSDDPDNLVRLTAEEHYVAHQLLLKIHPGRLGLVLALHMMTIGPGGQRSNNKRYAWIKRSLSIATSQRFKGRHWSEEQNSARAAALKRQWADPEFRAARSSAMRGKKWSEQSRAAKSASMRGKPGRVWTAEQKAKLSETKRQQHLLKGAVENEFRAIA
jgi:hypothetical protein